MQSKKIEYASDSTAYFNNPKKKMLEFIPLTCKTLLDVGCAGGAFGALVKEKYGTEVWGIDPSKNVTKIAPSVLDYFINEPFTAGIELPKEYFDVITFNDSLEHFPDPFPPLEFCRTLLRPNGIIVCCIPNVRYFENLKHLLLEMDWKYEDSGIRDRTHLRFFTKKSMIRTLEDANYQVQFVKGLTPYPLLQGKLNPIKWLLKKWIEDISYLQFALVATPKFHLHPNSRSSEPAIQLRDPVLPCPVQTWLDPAEPFASQERGERERNE